jgi:hypothetical protein
MLVAVLVLIEYIATDCSKWRWYGGRYRLVMLRRALTMIRYTRARPVRMFEGVRRRSQAFCTFCDPGAGNMGMDNVNHEGAPRNKPPDAPETRLSGPVAWTRWVAHWEKGSIGAGFLPARKARSS